MKILWNLKFYIGESRGDVESSEVSRFLGNVGTIDRSHGSSRRNKRLQGMRFEIYFIIFIIPFVYRF